MFGFFSNPSTGKKIRSAVGTAKVYVYDYDTGQEIVGGLGYVGNSEAGIWRGARYMDTRLGINAVDFSTRDELYVVASDFPGRRVAVKIWIPLADGPSTEWYALVDRARGWQGNEADNGKLLRKKIGVEEHLKKLLRR